MTNKFAGPRGASLLALLVSAAALFAPAPPAEAQYPGFWKVGNLVYAPCVYAPYTSYTDPSTGYERYMRYDFSSMRPDPSHALQPAGYGGPNHTLQYYGLEGKIYPILPQILNPPPQEIGFYPGPPPEAGLCAKYQEKNPGKTCPTASAAYSVTIHNNSVWKAGESFYIGRIEDECGPNPTPPPSPTPTPVPPGCRGRTSGCGGTPGPGTLRDKPSQK